MDFRQVEPANFEEYIELKLIKGPKIHFDEWNFDK